ncbi:MAG: DUF2156 domain-containing protein [Eubacterium sp.]|nr:DUF2156 domain-containing protein [Eubacterium sp.]MBR0413375.1 DUF2156 domain-containing protein [Eubacterium sp.]
MLNFKTAELADKEWVDECLLHANSMNCEYTFGNQYIWTETYNTQIAKYKDFMFCRWGEAPDVVYSVPLGEGDFTDAVQQIIDDAESLGATPKIYGITEGYKMLLQEAFFGKFDYTNDPGDNDYIYLVSKMTSLSGKKLHGKRNHISNFKRNNPDWQFEEICADNIDDCLQVSYRWIEAKGDEADDYYDELNAVKKALSAFDELGWKGGLIRANGEVVAYCLGEAQPNGKCFVTHFEKASADIQGAYPIINQEFTKNCLQEYTYVNREEDLGIEGLRRAKQSYYPEIILEKCMAVYND